MIKSMWMIVALVALGAAFPSQGAEGSKKIKYKVAKAECLKGDATLKGEALHKCIKEKRMPANEKAK